MIRSFADADTERLYRKDECPPRWRAIRAVMLRKLDMIDAAVRVEDLRAPLGNRLEKLKGDRKGRWSIRINDQWRVVFLWDDDAPEDVEIVDYH
ncbi:excinuclease ABC subunit A [Rhodomicrobium udaipurense JA643]|uniref:Type II toxin-antitoxin system RelE/ParE family toxin n=1 Tax=Rhodomicrobium udaipurense TaxID=1202716 RepID=A0A8I1GG08_9HYPH|nr:type II toxin-antitoxin system RelE/ParE family toxin [Rhodomicrobium udaipurense]KAI93958.1 excinuclease ABC subunit A [Rhodomicrobium udaipurense JA643]MBJ7543983.1 type II toxin-antitoxin system RelE/ParE family toxin [Rhodomicrobium udaipurense]